MYQKNNNNKKTVSETARCVSPPLDFSTFYPVLVQGKAAEMRLDTESIHLSRTQHLTGQQTQSLITMTTVSHHISTLHYTYTNKPVVGGQDIHRPYHIITIFQAHHPYLPNPLEAKSNDLPYEAYATDTHSL